MVLHALHHLLLLFTTTYMVGGYYLSKRWWYWDAHFVVIFILFYFILNFIFFKYLWNYYSFVECNTNREWYSCNFHPNTNPFPPSNNRDLLLALSCKKLSHVLYEKEWQGIWVWFNSYPLFHFYLKTNTHYIKILIIIKLIFVQYKRLKYKFFLISTVIFIFKKVHIT